MILGKISVCLALVCVIGESAAVPAPGTQDDPKGMASSLMEDGDRKIEALIPAKVNEDSSAHDRKLGDYFKRLGAFDSINHYSDFGNFQKKKDGESPDIDNSQSDRLKRPGFDSVHRFGDFARLNKRSVDRSYFARWLADKPWKRRGFDSIHHYSDFGRFNRRK